MIVIINEKGSPRPESGKRKFRWTPLRVAFLLVLVLATVPFLNRQYGLESISEVPKNNSTETKFQSHNPDSDSSESSLSPSLERERLCSAALEKTHQFDDDPEIMGTKFLRDQGIVLAIPSKSVSISTLEDVRLPIYNCGTCKDPRECRVHIHARLVGERAIRSAMVHQDEDGDFYVELKAPPVPGTYELHTSTRWWHGDELPTTYLGGPAKMKVQQTEDFLSKEAACTIFGSPQSVEVALPSTVQSESATEARVCNGIEEPGYWEWINKDELCQHQVAKRGECFVLDNPNATWHYRGDDCRIQFPTRRDVQKCLKDTSIVVYGDSLSYEFNSNLVSFLPEDSQDHLIAKKMVPFFKKFSRGPFEVETKRIVFVTDFNIAHIIQRPMNEVASEIAPMVEAEWAKVLANKPSDVSVEGIFYTGYLPYCERVNGVSFSRMQEGNAIMAETARKIGMSVFNTTAPTLSRHDASWDGLHFLLGSEFGSVSKFLTMVLIQDICGISVSSPSA